MSNGYILELENLILLKCREKKNTSLDIKLVNYLCINLIYAIFINILAKIIFLNED